MYCPRCGKAEQVPESYCRQCGFYLPDLSKPGKPELPPEDHLKANTVLNSMTIIVSFTLSFLLFAILPDEQHPLIDVTAGLLIAIGAWHIQTLIRTQKLKKQWKRRAALTQIEAGWPETERAFKSAPTAKLLAQADFANTAPASVTEDTTHHLVERPPPTSS